MMHETHTPAAATERTGGGWASLFVAIALITAFIITATNLWRPFAPDSSLRGPVTGTEFAAFLESRADLLRPTLSDFDGLVRIAHDAGDRPMIDVLRDMHAAHQTATSDAPTEADTHAP